MDTEFLLDFSTEFVKQCRRLDIQGSTRQAITILRLANARRIRKGTLDHSDLIEIAKLTTAPPHQQKATSIAEAILNGKQGVLVREPETYLDRFLDGLESRVVQEAKEVQQMTEQETRGDDGLRPEGKDLDWTEFRQWVQEQLEVEGFHAVFEKVIDFDRRNDSDLTGEFLEIARETLDQLNLDDLLENVQEGFEWIDLVADKIEEMSQANKIDQELLQDLEKTRDKLSDETIKDEFTKGPFLQALEDSIQKAESFEDLLKLKELAEKNEMDFPFDLAKEKGEDLQLSKSQQSALSDDVESLVREMIEEGSTDYDTITHALSAGKISTSSFRALVDLAIDCRNDTAIAGFLENRFMETLKALNDKGASEESLKGALGMTDGENILQNWFNSVSKVPGRFKDLLREYSRSVLIEIGRKWKYRLGDGIEKGILTGGTIRPWVDGDDFEQIDVEESLDNLLQLGKKMGDLEPSDILVRDYEYGKRAILLLIDSSGSMVGLPLKTAVATAVMLAYALRREELGIGVFQSKTSVFCSVLDRQRDLDGIVDGLLSLEGTGGTVIKAGLEWVEEELKRSRATEKIVFIVTDSFIYDLKENTEKIRNFVNNSTKVIFLVTERNDDNKNHRWLIEEAGGIFVSLKDWREFPQKIGQLLAGG